MAAPTIDEQTTQDLLEQASDHFQVPIVCILAAYDYYTAPPPTPEKSSGWGWPAISFSDPNFWAVAIHGPPLPG